jgi:hypothetical protein
MRRAAPDKRLSISLRRRRYLAHTLLAAAVVVCAGLIIWPPEGIAFYPQCPIHEYLGIFCPGCGATRAFAAVLHGHFMDALRLNAFFVALLPLMLAGALESYRRALRPGSFHWPEPPAAALYATLTATLLFTIARNLR